MRKLLGVVKVLVLMAVVVVLSGCVSRIVLSNTAFHFKNAPNPEIVFIIEDKRFLEGIGVDATVEVESSMNEISKAIDVVFKDKAVAIYPHDKIDSASINRGKIVKITPVEFKLWLLPLTRAGKFVADVSINGETKRVEAKRLAGITPFSTGVSETKDLSNKLFLDFAQKIREELKM